MQPLASVLQDVGHRVTCCHDPDELPALVARAHPHVCLVERTYAGRDRLADPVALRPLLRGTRLFVLTGFADPALWEAFDERTVAGVMSKGCSFETVRRALHQVAEGHGRVVGFVRAVSDARSSAARPGALTAREREVLRPLADGLPTTSIAEGLGRLAPHRAQPRLEHPAQRAVHRRGDARPHTGGGARSRGPATARRVAARRGPGRRAGVRARHGGAQPRRAPAGGGRRPTTARPRGWSTGSRSASRAGSPRTGVRRVLETVVAVHAGCIGLPARWWGPVVLEMVVERRGRPMRERIVGRLTRRQREVLGLLLRGLSRAEIADGPAPRRARPGRNPPLIFPARVRGTHRPEGRETLRHLEDVASVWQAYVPWPM